MHRVGYRVLGWDGMGWDEMGWDRMVWVSEVELVGVKNKSGFLAWGYEIKGKSLCEG